MRTIISTVTVSLALTLSCGDDNAPKRPENGTVKAWESCVWDGQQEPDLCEPDTACSTHGVCAPTCAKVDDCPAFEGFEVVCGPLDDRNICEPKCNEKADCPKTGGVALHCHNSYCVGDS